MNAVFILLVFLATLTSSFDIVGSIDFYGGNIKLCFIFLLLVIIGLLPNASSKRLTLSRPEIFLVFWVALNFLFLPNAYEAFRSISYFVWLSILTIYCVVISAYFSTRNGFIKLFKIYYFCFFVISVFGMIQFVLYSMGINICVVQNFNHWARVSACSYEPSYFATYLVAGWAMGIFCYLFKQIIYSRILDKIIISSISVCLLLTTSRIIIMCMCFGIFILILYYPIYCKRITTLYLVRVATIISFILIVAYAGIMLISGDNNTILLEGTGLKDTAAGSVDSRMEGIIGYVDLFLNQPLIGYSIGGVAGAVANSKGYSNLTMDSLRDEPGQNSILGSNVTLDIALGTGIIGLLVFLYFMYSISLKQLVYYTRSKNQVPNNYITIFFLAASFSLLLEFIALQFNQNILRNYFWLQIALVLTGYKVIKRMVN